MWSAGRLPAVQEEREPERDRENGGLDEHDVVVRCSDRSEEFRGRGRSGWPFHGAALQLSLVASPSESRRALRTGLRAVLRSGGFFLPAKE
jgi:hypothetical protein